MPSLLRRLHRLCRRRNLNYSPNAPRRCATALAIGFNISVSVLGGTTPLIAEALVSSTGNPMAPSYLLIAAGAIGALALFFTPEVAGRRLPGSGPAVENEAQARELAGE